MAQLQKHRGAGEDRIVIKEVGHVLRLLLWEPTGEVIMAHPADAWCIIHADLRRTGGEGTQKGDTETTCTSVCMNL